MLRSHAPRWLAGAIVFGSMIAPLQAQYDPDWERHFRVGILGGFNIKADFRNSGGTFAISGRGPGPVGENGFEHFFDDGFVRLDDTGNAQGLTSFWGFNHASQYDAPNQRMLMHHTSEYFSPGSTSGRKDDSPYVGLDVAYGGMLWRKGWVRIGWELGFGYLPISITDRIAPLDVGVVRDTYAFDLADVLPPGIGLPFRGGREGIGALLDDRAEFLSEEVTTATLQGKRTLDVSLFLLRLGPSAYFDLTPRWAVSLSAGPAMGIVTGSYQFDERLTFDDSTTARSRSSVSDTELLYGAYVSGAVMYHAVRNGDIYLGLQFTPLGSTTIGRGGRAAKLDLGGSLLISAGINWPF